MLNGTYILFISPDRGLILYAPVMLFAIIGIIICLRRKMPFTGVLLGIIGFDIVLYSMWGDPYGGWAFGPRYLIPAFAIASIFIAQALTALRKYNLFLLAFFVILIYSVGVNTLGALTSNSDPPQIEAMALQKATGIQQKYSIDRDWDLINGGQSKSFIFQTFAGDYITSWNYYVYVSLYITIIAAFLLASFKVTTSARSQVRTVKKQR
jgi:hypothetical protein